jgi:hypothetical protein
MVKNLKRIEKAWVSGIVISSHSSLKPQEHVQSGFHDQVYGGSGMNWARMLAYITGTVDQELLLRKEYLAAENRILRAQIKGRLLLSDAEKATLAEIGQRLGRKALEELAAVAKPDTLLASGTEAHRQHVRRIENSPTSRSAANG